MDDFFIGLVVVLLVFTIMISMLDIKNRNRDTLSVMKIETDNPRFVGTVTGNVKMTPYWQFEIYPLN